MTLPKFLVIRFPVGAAGNLITSILQCSNGVGHWIEAQEKQKPKNDWLSYFQDVFAPGAAEWLNIEPSSKHQLGIREIFSAKYPRGNDLSVDEFEQMELKYATAHYWSLKAKCVYIPIFWHKPYFPSYFENASFIDVFLDDDSLQRFDRACLYKNFDIQKTAGGILVTNREHRPSIVPGNFSGQNNYQEKFKSFYEFAREKIFNSEMRALFRDETNFDDSYGGRPRMTIKLSQLLNKDEFLELYPKICDYLGIDMIPLTLVESLHNYWFSCHKEIKHWIIRN